MHTVSFLVGCVASSYMCVSMAASCRERAYLGRAQPQFFWTDSPDAVEARRQLALEKHAMRDHSYIRAMKRTWNSGVLGVRKVFCNTFFRPPKD